MLEIVILLLIVAVGINQILVYRKQEDLMATLDEINAQLDSIDASIDAGNASLDGIQADIAALKDQLSAGGLTAAEEAAVSARITDLQNKAAGLAQELSDTDAGQ